MSLPAPLTPPPALGWIYHLALGLYWLAICVALVRPGVARAVTAAAAGAHLAATVWRGAVIAAFPLTNKMESFSAAALALALVTLATWRPVRLYVVPLVAVVAGTLAVALRFGLGLRYPVPPLRTIWYPLHVPLSFLAYGAWTAAAAAALVFWRTRDGAWSRLVDRLALQGFGLWSISMIVGGIWGVVAWGSYFLWDPKIVWSVILWFHYASFVHVKLTPSLRERPWVGPALAGVGLAWLLVAYVGTSFFFGKSSHAF